MLALRSRSASLSVCLLSVLWLPVLARADADGSSTSSLVFEITSPTVPAGLTLNPGGAFPGNFLFPDGDNSGTGSLTGMGQATCTPAGCETNPAGVDLEIQLSTDLSCISSPDGMYGGLEDSFALFGARNTSGTSLSLDLRFTTSWSISSTITDPGEESAAAAIDVLWAVPSDFCIELTSCASGSLESATASASCPEGSMLEGVLVLGSGDVDTAMGNDSDAGGPSTCDLKVTALVGASSAGDLSVTSSCSSVSGCALLSLSDDTIDSTLTEESCEIEAEMNYMVIGPNGNLTLRAGKTIRLGDGFSVGVDGKLTLELDPSLLP